MVTPDCTSDWQVVKSFGVQAFLSAMRSAPFNAVRRALVITHQPRSKMVAFTSKEAL